MEKQNPLIYLFRKTWEYSAGNRKKLAWCWSMFVVANLFSNLASPQVMAKIIDVIQKEGITPDNFKVLFGLLILTMMIDLIFWSLHGPARCLERENAFKGRAAFRLSMLKGVMTLPMSWHVDHHSGDTIDKVRNGTHALFSFAEDSFEIISALIRFMVSYGVLVYFSRPAAGIVLVMITISAWITIRFDRVMMAQYEKLSEVENNTAETVADVISNIMTVIILRAEKRVFSVIAGKIWEPFQLFRHNQRLNEWKWFLNNKSATVMVVIVMMVYFHRHIGTGPGVLVSSVYLLLQYLGNTCETFFDFTKRYAGIIQQRVALANAEKLAKDFQPERFTNHVLPSNWQRLEVMGLNFAYTSKENGKQNLDNVSLVLERGKKYAVVGRSGHGKSTLFSVMIDLFHAEGFELKVDGQEVAEGFGGICRAAILVPQKPDLFANTIGWNITMGEDHDETAIWRFTDMACFTDVVEELPNKFDSSIKEKGVNLSGGQQQRLALARGLLACRDKDIVLLDEPTSSLDAMTEMTIYQNIFREFTDKTVVSSVHRLHLLPMFDEIYLFDKGRIVASGTFQEMLNNSPEFQQLWTKYNEHHVD